MTQIKTDGIPSGFKYAPVLEKGRPVHEDDYFSIRHPHMDIGKRAKIFAPFAALAGFEDEIAAKNILYVSKRHLDEAELAVIDRKLSLLKKMTAGRNKKKVTASVEYYLPCSDPHHEAFSCRGTYETITDIVSVVDPLKQILIIGGCVIPFSAVSSVSVPGEEPPDA